MKIRRYLASNTQEAILKVKMDLGNEALILNTRKVRQKGLLRMFAKPMVEVLAAVDENYATKKDAAAKETPGEKIDRVEKADKEEKFSTLENRVVGVETMLNKIYEQMQGQNKKPASPVPAAVSAASPSAAATDKGHKVSNIPQVLQSFYTNLIKNEVEPEYARQIIESASEKLPHNTGVNEATNALYGVISGIIGVPETIKLDEVGGPRVVICVGPTGVGKTTTLAKIAANYTLNHKKKVGFITADTYRIAAVEQLKTYAEILGIPVSVIYSTSEIKDAIEQYSDKDLVFIDTAGRSFKNKSQFDELKALIAASNADEVYLVLSMTTSLRSCREILSNYSFLKNYKIIFTKIDEAPAAGIILNSRFITGKSLSYITTGQSVPDDIEVANIDRLTKLFLGSMS